MEIERIGEKSGHGIGPLLKLGKLSSHLIKDSLRIARLAFVDVSAAEMMTEDATNMEEWGPTTKTMAAISDASRNYDDYVRIVGVLRGRLALTGTKKWRQVFKAMTIVEYLLTHGPEQFIMEFREDKKRVEELTRFVFVDENQIDRGSALQSKAKQVNRLLVDESFFKEQRRRAQTVSRGILGFGSQSLKSDGANERVPDFRKCNTHHGAFSRQEEKADYVDCDRMIGESDTEPSSPTSQRSTNWSATSTSSADDSPQMSSASTEWNPFDESPTSSESFTTSSSPIAGGWAPPSRDTSATRKFSVDLELTSTASSEPEFPLKPRSPPSLKLPPLPTCRVPPPPPGGSKVGPNQQRSRSLPKPAQSVPDLILV
ncbi:hypothetical protein M758_4G081100 [Ceratodon purpureus]|nr:hypothetical protein M758_4G081100 [Ceratodon purpureus]